jgi:nitrite reductase/ring-hydroxylating ferredoxin subunit
MKRSTAISKIRIFVSFACTVLLMGCEGNYVSSIPNYPVFLDIDLRLAPYNTTLKNNNNSYVLFEEPRMGKELTDRIGYGGVIVYADFEGKYCAFDLACPHEALPSVKVKPNDLGQLVCDSCNSVYDISFGVGHPTKGPSKEGLKRYKTMLQGDLLRVTN